MIACSTVILQTRGLRSPPGGRGQPEADLVLATASISDQSGEIHADVGGSRRRLQSSVMPEEPSVDELKERQLDQELAERELLAKADTDADADRHRRRADKAQYLREKLEQRERADRAAAADQPPGAH